MYARCGIQGYACQNNVELPYCNMNTNTRVALDLIHTFNFIHDLQLERDDHALNLKKVVAIFTRVGKM